MSTAHQRPHRDPDDRLGTSRSRAALSAVALALMVALVATLAPSPAEARGRPAPKLVVVVDDSPEGCTLGPTSRLEHGGLIRVRNTIGNRPYLEKPDGSVVRFSRLDKVDNLPNGRYVVFQTKNGDPDGRVTNSKTVSINCPLPVNTAPDRFLYVVDAPLPEEPPVAVPVSEVMANATDADGDPLSVIDISISGLFGMGSIDDQGTPDDLNDDILIIDTIAPLTCGVDFNFLLTISDGRGGITRYGTLRFDNPFGHVWLCGNIW